MWDVSSASTSESERNRKRRSGKTVPGGRYAFARYSCNYRGLTAELAFEKNVRQVNKIRRGYA